jgi:hypothetical protein
MSSTQLLPNAREQSSYGIEVSSFDSAGNPCIPKTMNWSLMDKQKNIINSRQNVPIIPTGVFTIITLEGDDLQIVDPTMIVENRVLVVQGTNDDITLGQDSPFEYSFLFDVESMVT